MRYFDLFLAKFLPSQCDFIAALQLERYRIGLSAHMNAIWHVHNTSIMMNANGGVGKPTLLLDLA